MLSRVTVKLESSSVVSQRCSGCCRGRVELNRLNVFNVDGGAAAATFRSCSNQHGKLLVAEANYLAANDAAILEPNRVRKCWGN